jgi:NTE family protein
MSAALLARIPLFSVFTPQELTAIATLFVERRVAAGDTMCMEGEPGDSFLVIAAGELEVWGGGQVVRRLGPGEFLGEVSLLLGGARTATVTAARSSTLLVLGKEAFDRTLLAHPKVLEYLSRILSRRLATAARTRPPARRSTSVVVTGPAGLRGKSLVAASLALFLAEFSGGSALLVRVGAGGAALEKLCAASEEEIRAAVRRETDAVASLALDAPTDASELQLVDAWTALLERLVEHRFVVIDLGAGPPPLVAAARQFANHRVELVAEPAAATKGALAVVNLRNPASAPRAISHCEPFVLPRDESLGGGSALAQAQRLQAAPRAPASPPLRRLARKLLGSTVGIAVGGGAAFGIAHLGVLQALEEGGVPIDLLAGTSMGSIVAVGYATGLTPREMIDIAERIGTKRTTLSALDFTLSRPGLLAGDRLIDIFMPLAKGTDFRDLVVPCRTVATDIESGECVTIDEGPLDMAFRASCSVPVLWAPVRYQGRVLVDGGVVNPVPADTVQAMGADVVIAVNAVPPLRRGVSTVLSRVYRRINRLNPLAYLGGSRDLPNLFDVTMNSIQQLQHELGNFKAISADVRIVPDLSEFTWIEFYRPTELIARGYEAGVRAAPEVRRVLAERLGAA